jgi:hypothetical protein
VFLGQNAEIDMFGWTKISEGEKADIAQNWSEYEDIRVDCSDFQFNIYDTNAWILFKARWAWTHNGDPGKLEQTRIMALEKVDGKWETDYADAVVREDIGSLTRIVERENVVGVLDLLPEAVGSPISYSSLGSHLQISPITAKDYLRRLQDFYCAYSLHPYSRNIKRAILKAPKFYLMDWSRIADPAKRFENYVASELPAREAAPACRVKAFRRGDRLRSSGDSRCDGQNPVVAGLFPEGDPQHGATKRLPGLRRTAFCHLRDRVNL